MGMTASDAAYGSWREEEQQREEERQREEDYRTYQNAFKLALTDSPVLAVSARHHKIAILFRTEVDFAKSAVEEAARLLRGPRVGSSNCLVASWVRAYRAVEWYHYELAEAVAHSVAEPFKDYLKPESTIRAREFLKPAFMKGLRDAVLTAAFEPVPVVTQVEDFFGKYRQVRHTIVHAVYAPNLQESEACVGDAIALYNMVDKHFAGVAPAPIAPVGDL
jgi:hypothetical protein